MEGGSRFLAGRRKCVFVKAKAPSVIDGASETLRESAYGLSTSCVSHIRRRKPQNSCPFEGPSVALVRPIEPLARSESPLTWTRRAETKVLSKPSPRFRWKYTSKVRAVPVSVLHEGRIGLFSTWVMFLLTSQLAALRLLRPTHHRVVSLDLLTLEL